MRRGLSKLAATFLFARASNGITITATFPNMGTFAVCSRPKITHC